MVHTDVEDPVPRCHFPTQCDTNPLELRTSAKVTSSKGRPYLGHSSARRNRSNRAGCQPRHLNPKTPDIHPKRAIIRPLRVCFFAQYAPYSAEHPGRPRGPQRVRAACPTGGTVQHDVGSMPSPRTCGVSRRCERVAGSSSDRLERKEYAYRTSRQC